MRKIFVLKAYENADIERKKVIKRDFFNYLKKKYVARLQPNSWYRVTDLVDGCKGFGNPIAKDSKSRIGLYLNKDKNLSECRGLIYKDEGFNFIAANDERPWRINGKFEAVSKEVARRALIKEAKRRGLVKGCRFNSLLDGCTHYANASVYILEFWDSDNYYTLSLNGMFIWKQGVWTKTI